MLLRLLLLTLMLGLVPAAAHGHAERWSHYPSRYVGSVPEPSSAGRALVVCKADSAQRIRRAFRGDGRRTTRLRERRLARLGRCRFEHIQQAVDAARSGDRILIMPGVYREEPSRAVPVKDPRCSGPRYWESSGDNHQADGRVPTYEHQVDCPNARNLIAIIGDTLLDADRTCDHRCGLQVRGLGRRPRDVVIVGDRRKPDVIRADRADGFQLSGVTVEQGEYNGVDVVETNGFRITDVVARWNQNYGVLTFTSDHGLYDRVEAYGNGDSGIYPGSGPEYHCDGYGIEVRRVDSYGNMLGASGTSGNGTWTHHSRFHHNAGGVAADSFAPGHPGMPQDCSKWTDNEFFSNNVNYYKLDPEACDDRTTPFHERPKEVVCPQFQANVGVGLMFYGANDNIIARNRFYDQWRNGIRLFHVPAVLRGVRDPARQADTSHGNRFIGNTFGVRRDGTQDRNGLDVFWSEQGVGNCWQDNRGPAGAAITTDPSRLPKCDDGGSQSAGGGQVKLALEVPCASWHPQTNPDPPGCNWMTTPSDPGDRARTRAARARAPRPAQPSTAPFAVPLGWNAPPSLHAPAELPADRVMVGEVRNTGTTELRLDATAARLVDAKGRELPATAHFARGFTHPLYSPRAPIAEPEPEALALRLGNLGVIPPGGTAPLVLSWRGGNPVRAEFGRVRLPLP